MKKENLVFLLAGMVAGIIIGVLIASQGPPTAVAIPQQAPAQQAESGELPQGHPPIDNIELAKQLEAAEAVLEKDPENQAALVAAANLSYDLRNFQQAAAYYERAILKDPQNINLITDLGTSYFNSNRLDKAMEMYNRSLSINPTHIQSMMNLGVLRMELGDKKGAADIWEKLVTLYPDSPDANRLKQSIAQLRKEG